MRLAGYSKVKKEMNNYIDSLITRNEEGIELDLIFYQVDNLFGLGKLCVKRRLDILEKVGVIKIDGDQVKKVI